MSDQVSDQEWDYGALAIEVSAAKAEIERLNAIIQAQKIALEGLRALITELREAAK